MHRISETNSYHVTIESPDTCVRKSFYVERKERRFITENLGEILAEALQAIAQPYLHEIVAHFITTLACHEEFYFRPGRPTADATKDLCDAAERMVDIWDERRRQRNKGYLMTDQLI